MSVIWGRTGGGGSCNRKLYKFPNISLADLSKFHFRVEFNNYFLRSHKLDRISMSKTFKSANWRIVIPNLQQFKDSSSQDLRLLKCLILERLKHRPQDKRAHIKSQFDRGLRYYHIALERHANGVPHLDILLIYDKSLQRSVTDYRYLYKHGDVTTYRKLNAAIVDYGRKQDKEALSNLPVTSDPISGQLKTDLDSVLELSELKHDAYSVLYDRMKQDPLHFNLEQYVERNGLSKYITSWSSIKTKLKDMQAAAANLSLKTNTGFKYITRELIQERLSPSELTLYDSWTGYQKIVNYLNQIPTLGGLRQMKTLNLLLTGPASVGKTSLFHNPNHRPDRSCVQDYVAVYPMGMSTWFPQYRSGVYKLILWNQAKLTSYSYDTILKLLEGSYLDLPTKGGVAPKRDNPLIVMTSNLTLKEMIAQKFNHSEQYRSMARKNLAVRVENLIVPKGYTLFILQKLLVPPHS